MLQSGCGAHVVAADALALQLTLHHNLSGNAGVVGAWNPSGVEAHHAVVAGEAVHDGLVEGMAHVQGACHIGGWQLDGKVGRSLHVAPGCHVFPTDPNGLKGSAIAKAVFPTLGPNGQFFKQMRQAQKT